MGRLLLVQALFLGASLPGFASNFHEHYQYLPSFEDFSSVMDLGGIELGRVNAGSAAIKIFGWDFIQKSYGLVQEKGERPEKTFEQILQAKGIRTLGQLVESLAAFKGVSPRTILRGFFELNSDLYPTGARASESAYNGIGLFRGEILRGVAKEKHAEIFSAYCRRVPLAERSVITLSIPMEIVPESGSRAESGLDFSFLSRVRNAMAAMGSRTEFFLSVSRRLLWARNDDFSARLSLMNDPQKVFQGIDLVGSLGEDVARNPAKADRALIPVRFREVLDSLSAGGELRVHAFEQANEGAFYHAFWDALESAKNRGQVPRAIRIGHINSLSPDDIERFVKYRADLSALKASGKIAEMPQFVFEANIESNLALGSMERVFHLKQLARTIQALDSHGFEVVLGSDGQGILGRSSYLSATLKALRESGLPQPLAKKLVERSFEPAKTMRVQTEAQAAQSDQARRALLMEQEQGSPVLLSPSRRRGSQALEPVEAEHPRSEAQVISLDRARAIRDVGQEKEIHPPLFLNAMKSCLRERYHQQQASGQ